MTPVVVSPHSLGVCPAYRAMTAARVGRPLASSDGPYAVPLTFVGPALGWVAVVPVAAGADVALGWAGVETKLVEGEDNPEADDDRGGLVGTATGGSEPLQSVSTPTTAVTPALRMARRVA